MTYVIFCKRDAWRGLGCLMLLLFFAGSGAAAETQPRLSGQQAPEPHLVFKKSVVVKKYAGGQAHTEPHRVRKGDHLWKILREQYKLSNSRISFFCKIAKAVNPEIENIDQLYPRQNILIPFKYIPGDGSDNRTITIDARDRTHVVSRGEHLGKILRSRFGLPESVIFSRITASLIKEANPGITDINALAVGQTLKIPREVFAMQQIVADGVLSEERIKPPEPAAGKQQPQTEPVRVAAAEDPAIAAAELPVVPSPEEAPAEKPPPSAPEPAAGVVVEDDIVEMPLPDEELSDEEREVKQMLSIITRKFQGTDNSTGREVLSLAGRGSVALDYSKFPVYNFPWGKKVVFDYGRRLPQGMQQVITAQWQNAEVVSVQEKDDMESIVGKVLDVCGFYKVEKDGEYIVNRDNIQISVTGNWIVFKDSTLRSVFVVNLVQDGRPSVNPVLRSYLADMGLEVMDVGGAAPEEQDGADAAGRPRADYTEIDAVPVGLTDTILAMLGIAWQADYNTQIFQNMYSGFSLEVVADRMFQKDGATCLIDFHSLPARITTIIVQQGFRLLQIDPEQEALQDIAGRVLAFCGADYEAPPVTLKFDRGDRTNIKLTMPGYVVNAPGGRKLLTDIAVNDSISGFLREMEIEIIKY